MFFKFLIYVLVIILVMRWLGFSLRIISSYKKSRRRNPIRKEKRREGEIRITHKPQKDKKINREEGEYIEYEDASD